MNKWMGMGRCVKDPDVRYMQNENSTCIARFTLAIDRKTKKDNDQNADFINCVAFGKQAEFIEKYAIKGIKLIIEGRIQTGSYTNKENQKVYTTDIAVETVEFAESKRESDGGDRYHDNSVPKIVSGDGFMNIPDGIDEELPFN